MSKATNKLSMHIGSEISLKNFSFSQLIIAVKRMFNAEGIPGFVSVLVSLIELRCARTFLIRADSNEFQDQNVC